MHVHDLLGWPGPMTHRQFLGWVDWLSRQWNNPSRNDYYLMQLTAVGKAQGGQSQTINDQRIPFSLPETILEDDALTVWDDGGTASIDETEPKRVSRPDKASRPEDRIALSPASAMSGGLVRVTQKDGSLRVYNVKTRKYQDE